MSCGCGRDNSNCCGEIKEEVCYNCGGDIEKGKEVKVSNKILCERCGKVK